MSERRTGVRQRIALWAAAAVIAIAATALVAVAARDEDRVPPSLPLAADPDVAEAAETAEPAGVGDATAPLGLGVAGTYVPADDLPMLGGEAPAYRLSASTTENDVRRLAEALGIVGDPTEQDGFWHVEDGALALDVYGPEGTWSAYRTVADGDTAVSSSTERPANLPSEFEARTIALELLTATGVPIEGADVRVEDGITQWFASVEPVVAGLPAPGLGISVGVGPEGRIEAASGFLGEPEELGPYPLLDTRGAIERLNGGWAIAAAETLPAAEAEASVVAEGELPPAPATEPAGAPTTALVPTTVVAPAPAPPNDPTPPPAGAASPGQSPGPTQLDPPGDGPPFTAVEPPAGGVAPPVTPPTTVPAASLPPPETDLPPATPATTVPPPAIVVTAAQTVLVSVPSWDGSGTYLVPGYRLVAADDSNLVVPAVSDHVLARPGTDPPLEPADPDPTTLIEPTPPIEENDGP